MKFKIYECYQEHLGNVRPTLRTFYEISDLSITQEDLRHLPKEKRKEIIHLLKNPKKILSLEEFSDRYKLNPYKFEEGKK
jgi:hypothetical protein